MLEAGGLARVGVVRIQAPWDGAGDEADPVGDAFAPRRIIIGRSIAWCPTYHSTPRSPVPAQTNLPSGGDQARLERREPRGHLRLGRGAVR